MKTKNVAVVMLLLFLTGGFYSCEKEPLSLCVVQNPCIIDRPDNVSPIDWKNYNDVYTVYWTYHKRERWQDAWIHKDTTKTIKVSGWIAQNYEPHYFDYMASDADFILVGNETSYNAPFIPIVFAGDLETVNLLREKMATADLTKKYYIRGKLCFSLAICISGEDFGCCLVFPRIRVYSPNDISFE